MNITVSETPKPTWHVTVEYFTPTGRVGQFTTKVTGVTSEQALERAVNEAKANGNRKVYKIIEAWATVWCPNCKL